MGKMETKKEINKNFKEYPLDSALKSLQMR